MKRYSIETDHSSGLGYIAGAYITEAFGGEWRWSLRVRSDASVDNDDILSLSLCDLVYTCSRSDLCDIIDVSRERTTTRRC